MIDITLYLLFASSAMSIAGRVALDDEDLADGPGCYHWAQSAALLAYHSGHSSWMMKMTMAVETPGDSAPTG